MGSEQLQMFGGSWTEQKLRMLAAYLAAYATVMKKQPFELWYIDGFAGTGYRELERQGGKDAVLFPELAEERSRRSSSTVRRAGRSASSHHSTATCS